MQNIYLTKRCILCGLLTRTPHPFVTTKLPQYKMYTNRSVFTVNRKDGLLSKHSHSLLLLPIQLQIMSHFQTPVQYGLDVVIRKSLVSAVTRGQN
jgi:hypothetical protein